MDPDVSMIAFMQSYSSIHPIMTLASMLGSREFFLLLLPAVYWCGSRSLGLRLGLILTFGYGVNSICKLLWHSPRPYWLNGGISAWAAEPSFGMPSGHTQISASFWGLLAERIRSNWTLAVALILPVVIGLSRIYLGAHFPEDVLAGWGIGVLMLALFCLGERAFGPWLSIQRRGTMIAISFAASLAILGLYSLASHSLDGWRMPEAWQIDSLASAAMPVDPMGPKDALSAAGLLFGLGSGYAMLKDHGFFSVSGPGLERAKRYLLGLAGLIILWFGFGAAASSEWLFYLRGVLAGLWVAFLAPLLFLRMGLAEMR